jgi:hypothetical protein
MISSAVQAANSVSSAKNNFVRGLEEGTAASAGAEFVVDGAVDTPSLASNLLPGHPWRRNSRIVEFRFD